MRSARWLALAAALCAASCTAKPPAFNQPNTATTARAPSPPRAPAVATVDPQPLQGEPTSAELVEAQLVSGSCTDDPKAIEARIQKMRAEVKAQLKNWHDQQPDCWREYRREFEQGLGLSGTGSGGGGYGYGIGLGSIGTIGHGAGVGAPARARVASRTNNQVAGVDEADIVKTDGRYVYLAANGALRIVEAMNPKVVSVTKLSGFVRDLFIAGDRAVVYASSKANPRPCRYGYDCRFAGDGSSTRVSVIDLNDRARPKVVRTLDLSGSLMASRRIGDTVHTVVADGDSLEPVYETWPPELPTCGTREATVRAKFAALQRENERKIRASVQTLPTLKDNGVAKSLCSGVLRTAFSDGRAFTTIVSFDMREDHSPPKTAMLQSRPGAVFASADALYLSVVHQKQGRRWYSFYSSIDEVSEVHKFRIGKQPSATRYIGTGVVPGHVLNQFAMDEHAGHLRIATSRGRVPDPNVHSVVSVLRESPAGNLVRVGAIDGIAPSEDIRAVRFDGDRGYIVTFKKTDPLFVVDLKHPTRPAILGELKIPGFSTHLHRIDAKHLLSIGFDAEERGDFAYFDGVLLQIFDVSKPTEPKLVHREKIGSRGSSSEAATNHLAFNFLAERGMLAVPMTICSGGGNGSYGKDVEFSGLLVYDVSVEKGFRRLGGIDHGRPGANCSTWWSNATSAVKRSVFLDDLVYSIATDRLKVQRLGKLGKDVADIALSP